MSSDNEFYAEPMSTDMLKYIQDGSPYHLIINRRETRYKICDRINQRQSEWKGYLLSTKSMSKGLLKEFKAVLNDIPHD